MADGASRLFDVMSKAGTDTKSYLLSLTVSSINPIQLTDGDRLIIPEEFCVFTSFIDKTKISVNDKFLVLTFNEGQRYYIADVITSTNELITYNQQIQSLDNRVTILENRD